MAVAVLSKTSPQHSRRLLEMATGAETVTAA